MKIKLKIQQKIQLFIITASIVIYVIAIGYISFNFREMAYNNAIKLTNETVNKVAEKIGKELTKDLTISVTLSQSFKSVYKLFPKKEWLNFIHLMYMDVFANNPQVYALWDSWELSAIEPGWDKPYGRISNNYWRDGGKILFSQKYRSMNGDSELYAKTKSTMVPSINEPYLDAITDNIREAFIMTSLNAPVIDNGKYIGVVSLDVTLKQFQKMMLTIKPYDNSIAFMVSNKGIITGHPSEELLNRNITEIFPDDEKKYKILENINNGQDFNYISSSKDGIKTYYTFSPIKIGDTGTPWAIAISVPVKTIMAEANKNFIISIIVGGIGIFLLALIILVISRNISNPLTKITDLLNRLSKGHIDKQMKIKINTGDEIEEMTKTLNNSIDGLNKKVDFANHIGKVDLNYEFDLLSDEDELGKSLINMRDSLLKAKEEDHKRQAEDEKRRWANEGLAKFADILRQNNDNLKVLAEEIILHLVNYLNANQGGLFILNDEDTENKHLKLLSAFAYDRKKYLEKKIMIGEGLVGTCAIEKKTLYMTDIPQDYIEITSGLGGSNPNSLLIVPLKLEEDVLGVIEIASFNKFEKHEIEFVEKISQNIASTLSSVRINIKTSELLEKSQQQAEEMAAQEEEMRQNMEELQTTQEEAARREQEMQGIINAINKDLFVIELGVDMKVKNINQKFQEILGINMGLDNDNELKDIFSESDNIAQYNEIWGQVIKGSIQTIEQKHIIRGQEYWFIETLSPVINSEGQAVKVLLMAINITERKKKEQEIQNLLMESKKNAEEITRLKEVENKKNKEILEEVEKHKKVLNKIINEIPGKVFLKNSKCELIMVNKAVAEAHGMAIEELIGKSDYDFYDDKYVAEKFIQEEKELMKGGREEYIEEESFKGEKVILNTIKIPFYIDYLGETGILRIQQDITEFKKNEEALKNALHKIETLKNK